jgi:hypothetical protein
MKYFLPTVPSALTLHHWLPDIAPKIKSLLAKSSCTAVPAGIPDHLAIGTESTGNCLPFSAWSRNNLTPLVDFLLCFDLP